MNDNDINEDKMLETLSNDLQTDVSASGSDGCVECSSNYTAAEAFIQGLAGLVNQNDAEVMLRAQKQMLQRFEKTNEMLLNCNALSKSRWKQTNDDFKKHSKVLIEMKKDLDYIFRKIRSIKQKINRQYPGYILQQFSQQLQPHQIHSLEDSASAVEYKRDQDRTAAATVAAAAGLPAGGPAATAFRVGAPSFNESQHGADKTRNSPQTTVEYVQMEETIDNDKPIEHELIKQICSVETTNANDSSDCTSEDTG